MKKLLTLIICGLLSTAVAFADGPFRNHRFDSFKVLEPAEGSIVFIGNSITDMHCWPEVFRTSDGRYLPIVNRGNSGTYSTEQSDNIESYLKNKPSKVFMMIGTNDIATRGLNFTGEQVLAQIKSMVERIWMRSPETKIYLYCILKSNYGYRVESTWLHANELIEEYVTSTNSEKLKYVDIYDELACVADGGVWSYDKLHLTAAAYEIWCRNICEHLAEGEEYTVSTVYREDTSSKQNTGGHGGTHGMRATYFSMMPISGEDVLVFGDEMVKNGEWQELLGNYNVKNRGTGWGYGGDIATTSKIVDATYADTGVEKKDAKAIFIYTGTGDCNGSTNIETVKSNYKTLVDKVMSKSPTSTIYLMGLTPTNNAGTTSRAKALNDYLASLATENSKIRYVDTYTPLLNGSVANTKYFYPDNYLGGIGYVAVANKMKEALVKDFPDDTYNVISEAEAEKRHVQAGLRNILTQMIAKGQLAERGTSMGQFDAEKMNAYDAEMENVNALLEKEEITQTEVDEMAAKLNGILNNAQVMPQASTDGNEVWYQMTSQRSPNLYISATGRAAGVSGKENTATSATSMWKFVDRGDNTYDIVNREYGSYLSPTANYNTQIQTTDTRPAKGWTLGNSNTTGYFIISSGEVQLNQTGDAQGFALYNWSNTATPGADRTDQGCQLKIMEAEDIENLPDTPDVVLPDAVVSLDETRLGGSIPYQLTAEEADKVFALQSYTVVVDVTLNNSLSGRGAFVCAADPAKPTTSTATPTNSPYFALGHYNSNLAHLASTKDGDRFTATGAAITAGQNAKIAYTINRTSKGNGTMLLYVNGTRAHEFTYPLVGYEIPAFCDIKAAYPNANIYIGAGMANNSVIETGDGIVNSVQFYNTVLTDEQIAALANGGTSTPTPEYKAIEYSTTGNEHWYYITSAAENDYCAGKVMYYDGEMQKMRFGNKKFAAEYIWSFWESNGKLAIKNYNGEYFGTPGNGTGNSTAFGVVDTPNYIYNIQEAYGFYIIKDNAVELHAQNDNKVIVRWQATAGGASLWKFEEVDLSDAAASLGYTTVEQGKISTGIGNTDQPIVRSTIHVNGLEGTIPFQGVKGEFVGTDRNDITNVKAYFATNSRELFVDADKKMKWREENGELFGEPVTLNSDGTFTITGTKSLKAGANYLWITYDIADNAKEGNTVDVNITGYTIDGEEVTEIRGNPQHSATIFLSEGAVLMPMDKGSLYYRIPAITVTKDGKRLVTLTDDRKNHNADLPSHCYLVAQYSEDNGRTWSDPVTVAGTTETGGDYGHGDASIVTNRDNGEIVGIMTSAGTYGHGFFAGTAAQPPRWKTITSRDGGLTWEAPVDHTDDLFGANCPNPNTQTWKSGFSGSGAALQKRDGTLVSSFVNRQADNSQHFYFFMSKDGGENWYVSGTSGTSGADEPKTLERNNGDLAISVRSSGYNYYNYTSNDGETWHLPSQTRFTSGINGNACDGEYMVWCSTVEGNPWDIAFQTLPYSGSRENVSIALSTDEGATFGTPKTICPRGSAYSAAVVLPDGTLGVYYEENGLFGGYTMRFVRFSLDWASNGTYKFTDDAPFFPIKSTNPTAIEEVKGENGNVKGIYDLTGRRIENPTKGIYIIDGKKTLVK